MRSEEIIPDDLWRLLRQPQAKYVLSCAGLVLAVVMCFFGLRKIADRRLEPLGMPLSKIDQVSVDRALLRNGLADHTYVDGRLLVPAGGRGDYLRVINQLDIGPQDPSVILRATTDKISLLMTNEERRMLIQVAEQDAVAALLRGVAGIDDAYVKFSETSSGGLRPTSEVKAVVSIQPSSVMDAKLLSTIRRTVAGHRSGLRESNVTIVNRETHDSYDGSVPVLDLNQQAREIQRVSLQGQWNEKVTRVLKFIPGAKVETNIELRAGPQSPVPQSPEHLSVLSPARIVVSISVPASYYRTIFRQRAGDDAARNPTTAELAELESTTSAKVESLVQGLVSSSGREGPPSLHVALLRQLDADDPSLVRIESPAMAWLRRHANKIVQATMVLLAVGLVFLAFRDLFYENVPEDDEEPQAEPLRVFDDGPTGQSGSESRPIVRRDVKTAVTNDKPDDSYIHVDLTDLVRENPRAASAMLKSWVEKAS